ncbi:helical backbone metal receptor, partial [Hydrotalea sp.]|uniref:helical backbone metal receptor n=1 Tax=Hydrotalea sp. TaxID=2881279 RepID=UPI0026338CF6
MPSQTELLFYLGLDKEVKGITKFCIHPPEWRHSKTIVGGTKKIHLETIKQLAPDLIIANKEENEQTQTEAASHIAPVWVTDIDDLHNACTMILELGAICKTIQKAEQLVLQIQQQFAQLRPIQPMLNTAYFIWNNPNGGFYLWLTPINKTISVPFKKITSQKIIIAPGSFFSGNNSDKNHIRICYSNENCIQIYKAIKIIAYSFDSKNIQDIS